MPDPIPPIPVGPSPSINVAAPGQRFAFVPMTGGDNPGAALAALLKRPGSLIYQLHQAQPGRLLAGMVIVAFVCLSLYGLIIGSFSGGTQWWAAPLKTVGGTFLSALICIPSLYIFTCLSGAEVRLGPLCGVLLATLCLNALLLLGFAPVAWVFSQSTDSVPFMGMLHLGFWAVSMLFALRLIALLLTYVGSVERNYLRIWYVIFLLVCLQMTTALRPFIGQSKSFLPTKKLFFLTHWGESLNGEQELYRQ